MEKRDLRILHHLRKDSGRPLTEASKESGIPVTTIYDRMNEFRKELIKKQTVLLDFTKLGLLVKTHLLVKAESDEREHIEEFLKEQACVNSLYRGNGSYDFMAECLFKNFLELHKFIEGMCKNFRIIELSNYNIVEEIKKEDFLTKIEHVEAQR
jgi:DNA-binding Lrp family transcriptional regulator